MLAEAAESVGTPQIRNAGTLAGNVCQRPWCWYYRNGFPCFRNGGNRCFSVGGENQFHAIFGGGPSFIVNRWSPWRRRFASSAPRVNARFQRPSSSACRTSTPNAKTSSGKTKSWRPYLLPPQKPNSRSIYHKILDREA